MHPRPSGQPLGVRASFSRQEHRPLAQPPPVTQFGFASFPSAESGPSQNRSNNTPILSLTPGTIGSASEAGYCLPTPGAVRLRRAEKQLGFRPRLSEDGTILLAFPDAHVSTPNVGRGRQESNHHQGRAKRRGVEREEKTELVRRVFLVRCRAGFPACGLSQTGKSPRRPSPIRG